MRFEQGGGEVFIRKEAKIETIDSGGFSHPQLEPQRNGSSSDMPPLV